MVELSAVSVDQQVTCRGSAEFDVEVGVSTPVMVIVNCKLPQELGGVRVNGKFNICAQLTKMVVAPLQTSVGNDISLFSTASDEEGDPITYMWTSHSGSIADPVAASTTYTCTEAGDDDITVLVTDDDGTYCMSMWTVRVTCVAGDGNPCDDVTCEDDGNECTDATCNPANGRCETSDNTNACDGRNGTCNAGVCQPNDLCIGVDCNDNDQCTIDVCVNGKCSNTLDTGASCDGGAGTCDAQGVCQSNAESLYTQNFEPPMDPAAPDALILDTAAEVPLGPWLFFADVFDGGGNLKFNFGPFGAPDATVSLSRYLHLGGRDRGKRCAAGRPATQRLQRLQLLRPIPDHRVAPTGSRQRHRPGRD